MEKMPIVTDSEDDRRRQAATAEADRNLLIDSIAAGLDQSKPLFDRYDQAEELVNRTEATRTALIETLAVSLAANSPVPLVPRYEQAEAIVAVLDRYLEAKAAGA